MHLLLGMGGSSLAAEVFSRSFGAQAGYLALDVLDSTHPGAVLARRRNGWIRKKPFTSSPPNRAERWKPFRFMKFFYNQTLANVGREKAGRHFIAITDPGSGLETAARELSFGKSS